MSNRKQVHPTTSKKQYKGIAALFSGGVKDAKKADREKLPWGGKAPVSQLGTLFSDSPIVPHVESTKATTPAESPNNITTSAKTVQQKFGQGRGKGKGGLSGRDRNFQRRHRKVLRDNIQGITKPAIRRLARRGGVKRVSDGMYNEVRGILKTFLHDVIRNAVTYTEHSQRKTVTAMDVCYALKRQGRTLYGFEA